MTEEKKPFTVSDRRLFTSKGERRAPSEPEAAEADTKARKPPEAATKPPSEPAPPPPRPAAPGGPVPPMNFTAFLLSLAAQASLLLGQGGQPPDVEGAREMISILEMLRDKTEGRRTREEDEVLEGVLYELRMGYLNKAGVRGA